MTAAGPNSVEAAGPSSSGSMLVFNQVRPDVGGAHWGGYDLQKEPFLFPIGQPRVTLAGTRATRFTLCPNPPTDAPAFQPLKKHLPELRIAGLARSVQTRLPYLHSCTPLYCLTAVVDTDAVPLPTVSFSWCVRSRDEHPWGGAVG